MSDKKIYEVHAYRWGDQELHSYSVGVYSKKSLALTAAEKEEQYRGGKYECKVLEWALDKGSEGDSIYSSKTIKPLPVINTLKARSKKLTTQTNQ